MAIVIGPLCGSSIVRNNSAVTTGASTQGIRKIVRIPPTPRRLELMSTAAKYAIGTDNTSTPARYTNVAVRLAAKRDSCSRMLKFASPTNTLPTPSSVRWSE